MPIIYQKWLPDSTTLLGVWQIAETIEWFEQHFELSAEEAVEVAVLTPRKRLEWYAGRWLLHILLGAADRKISLKDEFGKPYLLNSDLHISISHSADKAAVIISKKSVGIDIQYFTEKIERISTKFMRQDELDCLSSTHRLEQLHVFWGAKESLYKAYGKRELDFRGHIFINTFNYDPAFGKTSGYVKKDNYLAHHQIFYTVLCGYSLTYSVEW